MDNCKTPGMLEIGRERAAGLGLDNIEFQEADAEDLPFADSSFDVVLSIFGVMLMNPRRPGTSSHRCSVSDFISLSKA